jgi:hypothetical protein
VSCDGLLSSFSTADLLQQNPCSIQLRILHTIELSFFRGTF